jgi:dihydroxy-acid dehydratase
MARQKMADQKIKKTPEMLRSARWFAPDDLRAFGHRSRAM